MFGRVIAFIFAITIVAAGCERSSANRNIVYKDLQDTTFAYGRPFALDMNEDGSNDLLFTTQLVAGSGESETQFIANTYLTNRALADTLTGELAALSAGDSISGTTPANTIWDPFYDYLGGLHYVGSTDSAWVGHWPKAGSSYLGVRLYDGTDVYNYGWVQMTFDTTNARVIVHDCAYNQTLFESIAAGER